MPRQILWCSECLYEISRDLTNQEKASKAVVNQRLRVPAFQLLKLDWPPCVLGDLFRLTAGAEQVIETQFNVLSRWEEPSDRILVAIERVGPLVVDPREVVNLELDAGNCVAQRFTI